MDDDFKKAMGYSAAALQLQMGILATLIVNGTLTRDDALSAVEVAKSFVERDSGLPSIVKAFATEQLDVAVLSIRTLH